MTVNEMPLEARVDMIASFIGDNFLRVAKALREILDDKPEIFLEIAKRLGISRRKAYALARINRQFTELEVAEERLYAIGWTKRQVIGRYLNAENAEYLLQLAEQMTSHDLETRLRGEVPIKKARVMTLILIRRTMGG